MALPGHILLFRSYFKDLCVTISISTLVLGVILGIAMLVVGETSLSANFTFDFGRFDGIWLMLLLPILATLVFAILSPLSYLVCHLVTKKNPAAAAVQDD